jgi:hypothetical protein
MSLKYLLSSVLLLSVVACSGSSDSSSDPAAPGDEQDITAGRSMLKGAWIRNEDESGGFGSQALYLSPDGSYFLDSQTVLLGVRTPPPRDSRETGKYTVNATKNTLTLNADGVGGATTYNFTYTPARILLGMPAKNGGPPPGSPAKLTIQRQAPECQPGQACSHIAFPNESFTLGDSYCKSDDDCEKEQKDKTWEPISQGRATCMTGADAFHGAGDKNQLVEVNRCEAVDFQK